MLRLVALSILLLLAPAVTHAAAIAHTFVEQNTPQTTTSTTYVDVTGAAIASGNFTASKKYLLYLCGQVSVSVGSADPQLRAVHGSTAFAESEMIGVRSSGPKVTWCWFTVWTAVTGEGIKLQFRGTGGDTAHVDQVAMFAMNLSDDLVENTDWFFAESATDATLSTTFTDGGAVTFTPGTAGHNWLALSYAQVDHVSTTISPISRISCSGSGTSCGGGASSTTPEARYRPVIGSHVTAFPLARVFTVGASSTTIKEQAADDATGTQNIRLHSSLFVLNLSKFRNNAFAYTDADTAALSNLAYDTQIQTLSYTPDVAGPTWIGTYWGHDTEGRRSKFRVQVDNSDQPAGQTTDDYTINWGDDTTDEHPHMLTTVPSLTAAAHTVDLDASNDSGFVGTAQHRLLWAVSMELPAGGGARVCIGCGVGKGIIQ